MLLSSLFVNESKVCKAEGIKPIIGCETYVAVGSRHDKKQIAGGGWGNNHLILLYWVNFQFD